MPEAPEESTSYRDTRAFESRSRYTNSFAKSWQESDNVFNHTQFGKPSLASLTPISAPLWTLPLLAKPSSPSRSTSKCYFSDVAVYWSCAAALMKKHPSNSTGMCTIRRS